MTLARRCWAEAVGTAMLLAAVVGSGVMGETLGNGNDALALLANAAATAGTLYVLIGVLGPVSGAHLNPAVTLAMRLQRSISTRDAVAYVGAQVLGAVVGVMLAHLMFDLPLLQTGARERSGMSQWSSELVATAGLLLTVLLGARNRAHAMPLLVAAYIFSACWFKASTSFANPAVTLARALTDTFAGIRPIDVPMFVSAQLTGALLACAIASSWLQGRRPPDGDMDRPARD